MDEPAIDPPQPGEVATSDTGPKSVEIRDLEVYSLKSIGFQNVSDHHTTTVIQEVMKQKNSNQHPGYSPEVEAMRADWSEMSGKKGQEGGDTKPSKGKGAGGNSDQDIERVIIELEKKREPDDEAAAAAATDQKHFAKYRHHQYVRRWGLISDDDGIDEEWFISSPPVLEEDDPEYLCDMCRHLDFQVLFSQRGLPGNQTPGATCIMLFGLSRVMKNDNCNFCRLLRRVIDANNILDGMSKDDIEAKSFHLNVIDDGPDYALRLEVDVFHEDANNHRFLLHMIDSDEQQPLHGLKVDTNTASMSRLSKWLSHSEKTHQNPGKEQNESPENTLSTLRLLDTVEDCVKEVGIPCRYACLSYVWGTGSPTKYTTLMKAILESARGLNDNSVELPQTIKDALEVVRAVGIRYIWIDALCILQDSDVDKAAIIPRMGEIYAGSALTIVASANSDPTQGLPGISVPRSRMQVMERVQGLMLGAALHDSRKPITDIQDSKWNSRAWTFQEQVLSPRSVYFTDAQICFKCPGGTFFEDTVEVFDADYKTSTFNDQNQIASGGDLWMRVWIDPTQWMFPNKGFATRNQTMVIIGEDKDQPEGRSREPAPIYTFTNIAGTEPEADSFKLDGTTWENYRQAVRIYTRREMTNQTDAINAFMGIADLVSQGTNTKFWYGMPEFALHQSLLWVPSEPLKRRMKDGKPLFPSWTWAAWQGPVHHRGRGWYNSMVYPPISTVQWFQEVGHEHERVVQLIERLKLCQESEGSHLLEQISKAESIRIVPSHDHLMHFDWERQGWVVERDEKRNMHIFTHEAYPGVQFSNPVYLPGQSITELPCKDGSLLFQTRSVPARFCDMAITKPVPTPIQDNYLQIGLRDEVESKSFRHPWQHIVYHQGFRAGFISLNVPLDQLNPETDECSFVVISRDTVSGIPNPHLNNEGYWKMDPQTIQQVVYREAWVDDEEDPPPKASEEPIRQKESFNVQENGDARWDMFRFGKATIFDVYNVLLLRTTEGYSERIGVGKMSYCAFHCASPIKQMIKLK